jgi:hypothetical protein
MNLQPHFQFLSLRVHYAETFPLRRAHEVARRLGTSPQILSLETEAVSRCPFDVHDISGAVPTVPSSANSVIPCHIRAILCQLNLSKVLFLFSASQGGWVPPEPEF